MVLQLQGTEAGSLKVVDVELPGAVDGPVAEGAGAREAEGPRSEGGGVVEEEADQCCRVGMVNVWALDWGRLVLLMLPLSAVGHKKERKKKC